MFKAALNSRVRNQDDVCLPLMNREKWDQEGTWSFSGTRNVRYFDLGSGHPSVYFCMTHISTLYLDLKKKLKSTWILQEILFFF